MRVCVWNTIVYIEVYESEGRVGGGGGGSGSDGGYGLLDNLEFFHILGNASAWSIFFSLFQFYRYKHIKLNETFVIMPLLYRLLLSRCHQK